MQKVSVWLEQTTAGKISDRLLWCPSEPRKRVHICMYTREGVCGPSLILSTYSTHHSVHAHVYSHSRFTKLPQEQNRTSHQYV